MTARVYSGSHSLQALSLQSWVFAAADGQTYSGNGVYGRMAISLTTDATVRYPRSKQRFNHTTLNAQNQLFTDVTCAKGWKILLLCALGLAMCAALPNFDSYNWL